MNCVWTWVIKAKFWRTLTLMIATMSSERADLCYLQFILVQVSWHAFKIKQESYKHCEVTESPNCSCPASGYLFFGSGCVHESHAPVESLFSFNDSGNVANYPLRVELNGETLQGGGWKPAAWWELRKQQCVQLTNTVTHSKLNGVKT